MSGLPPISTSRLSSGKALRLAYALGNPPSSWLKLTFSSRSWSNPMPHSSGSVPVSWLSLRSSFVMLDSSPKATGSGPFRPKPLSSIFTIACALLRRDTV